MEFLIVNPEFGCALFAVGLMLLGLISIALVESVSFIIMFVKFLQLDAQGDNCND